MILWFAAGCRPKIPQKKQEKSAPDFGVSLSRWNRLTQNEEEKTGESPRVYFYYDKYFIRITSPTLFHTSVEQYLM